MKKTIVVAFAAVALSTSAFANTGMKNDEQAGTAPSKQSKQTVMTPDKMKQSTALNEIHHLNQKEIETAKLVQKKAQSPQLKEYAQTILRDHQQADSKLMDLAKSQNIELSKYEAAGFEKSTRQALEKMSGMEFDRSFVEMAKMDHKQNLQEVKTTTDTIQNTQIQQYLTSELMPALEKHQQSANSLKISGTAEQAGEMGDMDMEEMEPEAMETPSSME